jgi:DNA integrity scanning protein DisA with diadenylate cyclase activity
MGGMPDDSPEDVRVESTAIVDIVCSKAPWCTREVFESTFALALELAHEAREGRRVGALFTLGSANAVLACSRPLILDPLSGHAPATTHITDPRLRGTIMELSQLDGAFVIDDDGTVVAACRYLDASAEEIDLPLGLGSRHVAGAAMSKRHRVIAVVVSESGVVRVFCAGELWAEIGSGSGRDGSRPRGICLRPLSMHLAHVIPKTP